MSVDKEIGFNAAAQRGRKLAVPGQSLSTTFSERTAFGSTNLPSKLNSASQLNSKTKETTKVMKFHYDDQGNERSTGTGRKKLLWCVVSLIGVFMILVSLAFYFDTFGSNAEDEGNTGSPGDDGGSPGDDGGSPGDDGGSPGDDGGGPDDDAGPDDDGGPDDEIGGSEDDFCPGGDEKVRELLAAEFENGYAGLEIGCLPNNAFSALNTSQKERLDSITYLTLDHVQLERVAGSAFVDPGLTSLQYLSMDNNSLSYLPGELLSHFPNIIGLNLYINNFTHLDSDVFRNSSLKRLDMGENPLVELPTAFIGWKTAELINCQGCRSLASFTPLMFSEATNFGYLVLSQTKLQLEYDDPKDLAIELGINSTKPWAAVRFF